jgi:hypothetical protein
MFDWFTWHIYVPLICIYVSGLIFTIGHNVGDGEFLDQLEDKFDWTMFIIFVFILWPVGWLLRNENVSGWIDEQITAINTWADARHEDKNFINEDSDDFHKNRLKRLGLEHIWDSEEEE